ncbi:hypothetical protein R3P38DRAFT_2766800 [Favolaschia claudopus]|uniref:Peptidase A1 domain-containing protein n=1 Tax=Favolaschia claudopus TaxID=2862362 RepID=A0AAW0D345_9AGAR
MTCIGPLRGGWLNLDSAQLQLNWTNIGCASKNSQLWGGFTFLDRDTSNFNAPKSIGKSDFLLPVFLRETVPPELMLDVFGTLQGCGRSFGWLTKVHFNEANAGRNAENESFTDICAFHIIVMKKMLRVSRQYYAQITVPLRLFLPSTKYLTSIPAPAALVSINIGIGIHIGIAQQATKIH